LVKHDLSNQLNQQIKPYIDPNVVKLRESILLPDACKQMIRNNTDEVVVVDIFENPIGIVTDEDVIKRLQRHM